MSDVSKFELDNTQINIKDASARTPTFAMASSRANIASGETISTLFGKIAKFFNDLKAVAFSGNYNDLSNKPTNHIIIDTLWTNSNPNTPQGTQDVTLSSALSNYDFYFIEYKVDYNDNVVQSTGFIPKGDAVSLATLNDGSNMPCFRRVTPVSATGNKMTIGKGFYNATLNTTNFGDYNGACVVKQIYGVRRG